MFLRDTSNKSLTLLDFIVINSAIESDEPISLLNSRFKKTSRVSYAVALVEYGSKIQTLSQSPGIEVDKSIPFSSGSNTTYVARVKSAYTMYVMVTTIIKYIVFFIEFIT